LASAWLLTLAFTALGAPSFSRVALLLPDCEAPGLGTSELREAVTLDLRDAGLTLAPAGELSAASDVLVQVAMDCSANSELTLSARFANDTHTRRVDLGELPLLQRARALSLALAELLALFKQPSSPVSTEELGGSSAPPPAASAPASAPAARPATDAAAAPSPKPARPANAGPRPLSAPSEDRQRAKPTATWSISLAPELRFFDTTWLYGGRGLVRYGAWSTGLDVLRAEESVSAGSVTTLLLHGSVAYSFVLSGGLERPQLEASPRLGLGRTIMTAVPTATARGNDAADVYFDGALGARYSLRVSPLFRLGLGAELGYARGPIGYADDLALASTAGSFASVLIDASFHP
jgi:hypothetical protein